MMLASAADPAGPKSWLITRNRSLSPQGQRVAVAVIAAGVVLVALFAAALGAWMVLPFAGLEIVLVTVAFGVVERDAFDFERVRVANEQLSVERRAGDRHHALQFNARWAVIELVERGVGCELFVRYGGRRHPLGILAADGERRALALGLSETMKLERR